MHTHPLVNCLQVGGLLLMMLSDLTLVLAAALGACLLLATAQLALGQVNSARAFSLRPDHQTPPAPLPWVTFIPKLLSMSSPDNDGV